MLIVKDVAYRQAMPIQLSSLFREFHWSLDNSWRIDILNICCIQCCHKKKKNISAHAFGPWDIYHNI